MTEPTRRATELNNSSVIRQLEESSLYRQQLGLQHLLSITSEPDFQNMSPIQQLQLLSDKPPFHQNRPLTREETRNVYRSNYRDLNKAISAAELGATIATTSYMGGMCLAGLLTSHTGLGIPVAVTQCPMFALGVLFTVNNLESSWGNNKRNRTTNEFSALLATKSFEHEQKYSFLGSEDFNPEAHLSGLSLDLQTSNNPGDVLVDAPSLPSVSEDELRNEVNDKIPASGYFSSREELEAFVGSYITKIGKVQRELIEQYLIGHQERRKELEREARDKAAFYQSLHGLVSTVLSQNMQPNEARLLSEILNAGFQYLTVGAITPLGWGAIGLNIVNTLLQSNSGGGLQAVMEALGVIKEQLDVILERVNAIYYTQIDILKKLDSVLDEIIYLRRITVSTLEGLSRDASRIYLAVGEDRKQHYYDLVQSNTSELRERLYSTNEMQPSNDVASLRELQNLTLELDNRYFTGYSSQWMSGNDLYETLTKRGKYDHYISLYDSIGLISAMADFNLISDGGQSTTSIVHPLEFYTATNNLVDWCLVSSAPPSQIKQILTSLFDFAKNANENIKMFTSNVVLAQLSSQYQVKIDNLIHRLYEKLRDREEIEFSNRGGVWAAFAFSSSKDFEKNVDVGKALRSIGMSNDIKRYHSPYDHPEVYIATIGERFNDARNDHPGLTLLIDLGIVTRETTNIINWYRRRLVLGNNIIGTTLAKKVVNITIDQLPISSDKKVALNRFQFSYEKELIVTGSYFIPDKGEWVTSAKYKHNYQKSFIDAVAAACKAQLNREVEEYIPDFQSYYENKTLGFHTYLIEQYIVSRKVQFAEDLVANNWGEGLNGIGTSLLCLSHLNKLMTSEEFKSDRVDFYGWLFTEREAKRQLLEATSRDFSSGQEELLGILSNLAENSDVEYRGQLIKLNPAIWRDAICLQLKYISQLSLEAALRDVRDSSPKSADPYLADSLNRIQWCIDTIENDQWDS